MHLFIHDGVELEHRDCRVRVRGDSLIWLLLLHSCAESSC